MVPFPFRLLETLYVGGRYDLDFGGTDTVEIGRGFSVDDANFNLRPRIPARDIRSPLVFFRRITANHKCNSNHGYPALKFSVIPVFVKKFTAEAQSSRRSENLLINNSLSPSGVCPERSRRASPRCNLRVLLHRKA